MHAYLISLCLEKYLHGSEALRDYIFDQLCKCIMHGIQSHIQYTYMINLGAQICNALKLYKYFSHAWVNIFQPWGSIINRKTSLYTKEIISSTLC